MVSKFLNSMHVIFYHRVEIPCLLPSVVSTAANEHFSVHITQIYPHDRVSLHKATGFHTR